MTGTEFADITEAMRCLDEAEAYMRLVDLDTTPITLHFIEVARVHCLSSMGDVERETRDPR